MTVKIQDFRKKMSMSQSELAEKINVSRSALSGYETGKFEAEIDTYIKICDVFGVPLDDLFGHTVPGHGLGQQEKSLLEVFGELNVEGQEKLIAYAKDLADTGKYSKKNTSAALDAAEG